MSHKQRVTNTNQTETESQSVRIISLEYPEQTSSKMHKNIEIKRKCKELRALADSALWLP